MIKKMNFLQLIVFLLGILDVLVVGYLSIEIWNSVNASIEVSLLNNLVIACISLSVISIIYCFLDKGLKRKFSFFSFQIAFYILILGRYTNNLFDSSMWGKFVFNRVSSISYINEAKGLLYIFLSQITILLSYIFSKPPQRENISNDTNPSDEMHNYRIVSEKIMYIGAVAAFIKVISKVIYVFRYGYLSTYLSTGGALYQNAIIDLFDKFYILGFYGYLATFPDIKHIKKPLALYFIYSILNLLTGTRGGLVINLLFIVWYFAKVDDLNLQRKQILTKGKFVIISILALFSAEFLFEYGFTRTGNTVDKSGFFNTIVSFIDAQGGSGKYVALGLENREEMLNYISPLRMIDYPILNFLLNNSIARVFTGGVLGQSTNTLLANPSFSSVITYITNPNAYFNGGGLGTSYVAELAVSFGVTGIILGNILLGRAFKIIDNISLSSWSMNIFLFNSFTILTYIPRHATLQIIPESVSVLIYIVMVNIILGKGRKRN